MKKLLSLLLAAIMVLGIVAVPAFADATVALTVTGVGATVKPGDEFTAELRVPKFSDPVSGYELHINFEKKILEVTDVQFTGYNDSMVTNAEEANRSNPESNAGSVVSTMARAENTVLSEDLVLTVKFKVRSDAASGTYDKLVWINEEATAFGNVDEATGIDGLITVNFGNKTFGAKVEGGNTTVIPEGAPFTAVYTDIEGAPVTVTKQNGKVSYDDTVYGGETDHWHIVIPENATKLYITYPKDSVLSGIDGYLHDAFVVWGFIRTHNITYNEVSIGFYTFKNVTDDGDSVTLAIDPSEFVGEFDGVDGDGDPYKYTKGFTPEDKAYKATGHITVEYGEAYTEDTPVIPEGAPFTAVYTDIEGAPVTVTKQDGKEDYTEINRDYDGGETDRWHIVVPENAQKLYLVYPKSAVKYLNDDYTKMALGYQKYYYVGSDQVDKGLFQAEDFEIKDENIIIAIKPNEFVGVQQITNPMGGVIKYTRGFTFRDNDDKATGHITIEYGEAYYSDEDAAKAVDNLIAAIGKVEFTDESKGKIDAARAAYDKLTDAQKKLVKSLKVLTDAEAEYERLKKAAEDEAAATAVDNLIAAIGKIEFTDESKGKIDAARAAYDKLTDAQKKLVKNLKVLTDAEAEYQRLLDQHKADEAAAKAVDDMVNKLQPVTVNSGKAIEAARKAFDALTPAQKKLLDPKTEGKLVAAENEYKVLIKDNADEMAAKEVEDKIARLQPVTKDSGKAIKDARSSYEALTPEQKALVSKDSIAALDKAEKLYDMIIASTKPGTAVGDNTGSTSGSGVIKITANAAAKGEQNPNTGAPAMSIAPAMLVLAAAALVLKKHK